MQKPSSSKSLNYNKKHKILYISTAWRPSGGKLTDGLTWYGINIMIDLTPSLKVCVTKYVEQSDF